MGMALPDLISDTIAGMREVATRIGL
jgi:hypothetical protein